MALLCGSPQASALVSPLFTECTVWGNTDVHTGFHNVHTNSLLRAQQVYVSFWSYVSLLDLFPTCPEYLRPAEVCFSHSSGRGRRYWGFVFSHQSPCEPPIHFLTCPRSSDKTFSPLNDRIQCSWSPGSHRTIFSVFCPTNITKP